MTTVPINFGPWLPDQPELNNPGVTRAFNVVPSDGAYRPMQRERLYANTVMAGRPRGATSGLDPNGNAMVFGGDDFTLYQLQPGSSEWTDVTRTSGTYTGSELNKWRFAEYGSLTIATNYADNPQAFDRASGNRFEDLTDKVKGRYLMVLKDFVVLGNIFTPADGAQPNAVMWSGNGDPGTWTYSQVSMSDFQVIQGYGAITGLVGGEYGTVFMQRGIARMTFVGGASIFQFDPVVDKGCTVPESLISVQGKVFFLSDDGFYMYAGGQLKNIGLGKINQTFSRFTSDVGSQSTMTVESDPANNLVYWLYASNNSTNKQPDRYLVYNYATDNWSEGESGEVTSIFRSMSLPYTLEQLGNQYGTAENIPAPLDSPIWAGGKAFLAGLDREGRVFSMSGDTRTAELTTGEFQTANLVRAVNPKAQGERSMLLGVRPDVHSLTPLGIRARVEYRNTLQSPVNTTTLTSMTPLGICPQRVDARYHRVTVRLEGGDWQQAMGIQIDAVTTGNR